MHTWPGNIRELRNLMERLAYLSSSDRIETEDVAFILSPRRAVAGILMLDSPLRRRLIASDRVHQNSDRAVPREHERTAKRLRVYRSNLYRKMRQLGMHVDQ